MSSSWSSEAGLTEGLAWAVRVPYGERAAFESWMRERGAVDFEIKDPNLISIRSFLRSGTDARGI